MNTHLRGHRRASTRWKRAAGLTTAVLLAFAITACGGDDDSTDTTTAASTSPSTTGGDSPDTSTGAPVRGGILEVAQYGPISGLDPARVSNASAPLGAAELAAIYDTIVRYNPETSEYEPRTGSFQVSDDLTTWTLSIKPGITFSDGSPYDAEAVKAHVERLMSPDSIAGAKGMLLNFVDSITVVDAQTLEFKLTRPWAGFQTLFTKEAGMVASAAAVAAAGEDFAVNPGDAGAGPFVVESYTPGEELVLTRNPTYWGDEPPLDGLRFSVVGGADPELMLQALQADDVQMMTTRNPEVIAQARDDGYSLITAQLFGGSLLGFNAGHYKCVGGRPEPACTDQPDGTEVVLDTATADPRVRLAIAKAIDHDVINQRAYQGTEIVSPDLYGESFPWNPGVPGIAQDVDGAKQLVEEAKADGWDGSVKVVAIGTPQPQAISIAVQAMLENVGISVDMDNDNDVSQQVTAVSVNRDYDVAVDWGYELPASPDEFYSQLSKAMNSTAPRFGYSSPDMDAALDALRVATTDAQRTEAFRMIAEVWNRDVPAAILGMHQSAWITSPKVHGIEQSTSDVILLSGAWLES